MDKALAYDPAKGRSDSIGISASPSDEDELHTEEDVKIKRLLPFLKERGYTENCLDFDVAIEIHEGRKRKNIFADVVVYSTRKKAAPLLICETKGPREVLSKAVREQAISYARLLPRIAPLALITNGQQIQVYHSVNKTRIAELPHREELDADIVKFILSHDVRESLRDEAKHELFILDDVRTFKNLLRACHNEIRNNEGLDPTVAFDEMSKVLFCKLYEEKENSQANRFRLGIFDDTLKRLKINIVRKILDEAKKADTYREIFDSDATILLQDRTVRKIVSLLESYDLGLTAFDIKGEAFEYFLGETFTGGLGEFFTPRNIVEFMIEAMSPKIGDRIIDPFCGTGGFLIYAFEVISEKIRLQEFSDAEKQKWRYELSNRCLFGTDWKERTSQACKMNMIVHGDGSSGIFKHDGFTDITGRIEPGMFDLCITNPPFGSFETDQDVLGRFELGKGKKSQDRVILALERCLELVRPGGRVAIIVIDGVLNNISTQYVRDFVRTHARILGIISLNKETFEGYGARAKTSILVLERKEMPDNGQQDAVFMAIARNTGLAPNGDEIVGNVLPDILLEFQEFQRGGEIGQHPECWVTQVKDRLDAEFYAPNAGSQAVNLSQIHDDIATLLRKSRKTLSSLASAAEIIAAVPLRRVLLDDLLEEVRVSETLKTDQLYKLLGIRWWGGGAFIREEKLGREIKAKKLNRAFAGMLTYNRLFAFRGSFALLQEEHDECYVSGEFPMFQLKAGIEGGQTLLRYLVHCLNSQQYLIIINAQSTGSTNTSRNRFNQKLFLRLQVFIPETQDGLTALVGTLDAADELRLKQEQALEKAKMLREGVQNCLPGPMEP